MTRRPPRSRSRWAWHGAAPGPTSVYLSPAPLYHSAPLVYCMSMLRLGATVVVMEHFDPAQCLELIERHRVTHAQFVPTMFVRMLRLPESERTALRRLEPAVRGARRRAVPGPGQAPDARVVGSDHRRVLRRHRGHRVDVDHRRRSGWRIPGRSGRPLSPAHVVGPDGEELGPGQEGVVYFEGGRPFEYHNDPPATASMVNARGWRTLGDIGVLDEDGYLYLTDRQAHMIISGGVNIYPQEAENVLASDPRVADVAVIGVPDPEMGEAVKAVIELVDPSTAGPDIEAELIAACREQLAAYKCPRTVDFVAELPRDPNGKLYKRLLRGAVLGGPRHPGGVRRSSGPPVMSWWSSSVVDVVVVGARIGRGLWWSWSSSASPPAVPAGDGELPRSRGAVGRCAWSSRRRHPASPPAR